jgi:hypothetical protein
LASSDTPCRFPSNIQSLLLVVTEGDALFFHDRFSLVLQVAEVVECRHQVPGLRQRVQRRDEGEGWLEGSHELIVGRQELTSLALG